MSTDRIFAVARLGAAVRRPDVQRFLVAFAVGGLAFLVLGTTPTRLPATTADTPAWSLPAVSSTSPTPWGTPVWASEPAAVAAATAVAPQPRLLGTVRVAGRWQALFEMPDGRRVRAAEGERLPDGAEVTTVAATRAEWRDASGARHDARLLDARQP